MRVQQKPFYADLFSKPSPMAVPAPLQEPPQEPPRALLPMPPPAPSKVIPALPALPAPIGQAAETGEEAGLKRPALFDVIGDVDIHNMSPRQITGLGQDLYAAGVLSFEDYSLLAFQPELHPDFDRTIGALTGERAAPDRRRDFVGLWTERAAFERRHNPGRPDLIEQSERIASVLRRIETPTDLVA